MAPYPTFTAGRQDDVPLLIGSNAEEAHSLTDVTRVKADTFDADVERSFGALPTAILAAYPHASDEAARQARLDLERDLRFGWDMWAWARLQTATGQVVQPGAVALEHFYISAIRSRSEKCRISISLTVLDAVYASVRSTPAGK